VAKFKQYIQEIRVANGDEKICLYMDNLSAHRSKKTLACMKEHGIRYIFNAVNSPDFNPIEYIFAKVKQKFKSLRA
jgi:transposase